MADKKPTKEQYAKFKSRANDQSISAEARATFQKLVDKFKDEFETAEKDVEKVVEDKPKAKRGRKPSTSTATKRGRKPSAKKTEQSADDIAKAKAEIKKRTGKTEEECESIIEEYKALRTKAQTRKKAETKAKEDNVKRVTKLKKDDNVIEGTTEKTADAVIETNTKDIAEKIEKEISKVEDKVEKEETAKVKKEVEKQSPNKSATEKKKEVEKKVEEKVEKKVKEKTKVVVKKVIIDTTAMLSSIAESLGKFDKDSQKEFLMKLRSDIDKLLAKYMYGGDVSGATQQLDITQSNLSASSVNPSKFARGGGVEYFTMKDGSKMSKEEWYEKMEDKLGFEKFAERILKDSQFGRKHDAPQNSLEHNMLNKKAVIGKKSVTISSYTPNTKRHLDSQTFNSLKKLDDYLNENQILARGGGIMADGRIVLREFNGIGGNKNKTYKLIKDDRDSDGKPYYTLIEYPTNSIMAQGDSFEEVNGLANIFSGKFARGGGVKKYEYGGYNGWTNYATWVTNLEILDGIDWRDYTDGEPITKDMLEDFVNEAIAENNELAVSYAERFLSDVNYYEIAEHINENFDLEEEDDEEYANGGGVYPVFDERKLQMLSKLSKSELEQEIKKAKSSIHVDMSDRDYNNTRDFIRHAKHLIDTKFARGGRMRGSRPKYVRRNMRGMINQRRGM